ATNIANVINMLQSSWGLQPTTNVQTFTANIQGDVNGDLLINPSALSSQNAACGCTSAPNNNLTVNAKDSGTINNNIDSTATSGNASTGVRVFNLTGRQIIDSNALLVFINVAGQWVGFLMDASQTGATAAAIGGGVTQNCVSCGGSGNNNTNINATNIGTINN